VQRGDAEHTDMLHALQWPRSQRVLIPEITAVHLSTSGKVWGVNWHGRKSPRLTALAEKPHDQHHRHHPPRPHPCPYRP
jgi:hypothetical protein